MQGHFDGPCMRAGTNVDIFPSFQMLFVFLLFVFVFSFSSYYVNGRSATREDFLSPEVLDSFATAIHDVLEVPALLKSSPRGFAQRLLRCATVNEHPPSLAAADSAKNLNFSKSNNNCKGVCSNISGQNLTCLLFPFHLHIDSGSNGARQEGVAG